MKINWTLVALAITTTIAVVSSGAHVYREMRGEVSGAVLNVHSTVNIKQQLFSDLRATCPANSEQIIGRFLEREKRDIEGNR